MLPFMLLFVLVCISSSRRWARRRNTTALSKNPMPHTAPITTTVFIRSSVCMLAECVYMYAYVYVCLCICMPMYMYAYVYVCICICICVCIHMCVCTCTCMQMYMCMYMYMYMCMYMQIRVRVRVRVRVCMLIYLSYQESGRPSPQLVKTLVVQSVLKYKPSK